MQRENVILKRIPAFFSSTAAQMVGVSLFFAFFLLMVPGKLLTDDSIPVLIVAVLFALLLLIGLGSVAARRWEINSVVYRLALVVWWSLLACEVAFDRTGESTQSSQGNFSSAAYGEGIMWLVAFAGIFIISLQYRSYLKDLFTGPNKWITSLVVVCVLSVPLSPGVTYSLAWAFKLTLVFLVLRLGSSAIGNLGDIVLFLKTTMWGLFLIAVTPTIIALSDPKNAFEGVGGRLNAGPDPTTMTAASVMLIAVILFTLEKKPIYIGVAVVGVAVMLLCLGKTGNAAGIFSLMLFFVLQRKFFRSLGLLLAVGAIAAIILSATPLADHLESYQGTSTLTGRTVIWEKGIEGFKQSPIWGHGYLASYFSFDKNSDLANKALNLHNSFLEVAYNNGLLGFIALVMVNVVIVRSTFKSMGTASLLRERWPTEKSFNTAYILSVGTLALYTNLFINSLLNVAFAGKANNNYMLFLALFFISDWLRRYTDGMKRDAVSGATVWRTEWQLAAQ